jgi:hypothetical protein
VGALAIRLQAVRRAIFVMRMGARLSHDDTSALSAAQAESA